jgi:hypothetical protein
VYSGGQQEEMNLGHAKITAETCISSYIRCTFHYSHVKRIKKCNIIFSGASNRVRWLNGELTNVSVTISVLFISEMTTSEIRPRYDIRARYSRWRQRVGGQSQVSVLLGPAFTSISTLNQKKRIYFRTRIIFTSKSRSGSQCS